MSKQITTEEFRRVVAALGQTGAADIAWSESLEMPTGSIAFAMEAIFVICNSGMRYTVAQGIFERCKEALLAGRPVLEVFGHKGKASAIEAIWADRDVLLSMYQSRKNDAERLELLEALPWIGPITKYHLAKNFGMHVAKPDVHLQRLADREGCTAQDICDRLAAATGYRASTIDTVLWRACADGLINSRTGAMSC